MEKLFGCFTMSGKVIKPRRSRWEESSGKDKSTLEGDSTVINLENRSL